MKAYDVLWIRVILLLSITALIRGLGNRCEPVLIPMCKTMAWNMTSMPNLLHHSTQENAILAIDQYVQLVNTHCSPTLTFFLCSMYSPICTVAFASQPIPPCKSVCEEARKGCEPIMNKYNVSWPESLECKDLPVYENGVCISPKAIVSTMPKGGTEMQTHPPVNSIVHTKQLKPPPCNCPKRKKLRRKLYMSSRFHYVIRGRIIEQEILYSYATTTVLVLDVLKSSSVRMKQNSHVTLWTLSPCVCPKLSKGKEYLLLGYEDMLRNRVLYNATSAVTSWKKAWHKKIKNWESRMSKHSKHKVIGNSKKRCARGKNNNRRKRRSISSFVSSINDWHCHGATLKMHSQMATFGFQKKRVWQAWSQEQKTEQKQVKTRRLGRRPYLIDTEK